MKLDKKTETKENFIKFLNEHPELRFWQSIYSYTGYSTISVGGDKYNEVPEDPFYWEGKND